MIISSKKEKNEGRKFNRNDLLKSRYGVKDQNGLTIGRSVEKGTKKLEPERFQFLYAENQQIKKYTDENHLLSYFPVATFPKSCLIFVVEIPTVRGR